MNIEQSVNSHLNKYPRLKKIVKRCYQRSICAFSPSRAKAVGDITPVSPNDGYEYFFGYYDKSPWDATDCYMLCMKARDTWSDVSPREKAQIILIDTAQRNKVTHLAETSSWNVQQGCMLQWLGPDYRSRVIFNDCRDGRYCSVILKLDIYGSNISVREENVLPAPVYSVASDGSFALTLDFSRLYRLRPGYGYYNIPENTASEKIPDAPCIWYMSLKNGEIKPVLKYTDFAHFEPRKEMEGAEHKVNHIMISPNGKRFMVLHRWFQNSRKYTRLITCNVDGTEMFNLSDDDMTSHCCWKNDEEILAFANKRAGGCGYYLMKDKTHVYEHFWSGIDYDGHPSYSPDGSKIVFDRYPDRSRMASVMVSSAENREIDGVHTLARVFAPFKYDNDTRCDLHPRWNRKGDKICFDSVYDGHRRLCFVNLYDREEKADCDNQSLIMESRTKILYIVDSLKQRFGVTSVVMNYFRNIDKKYLQIDFLVFNDSEREIIDEIRNAGSDVFFMPKPCVKNIPYIIKFYKTFFEIHNDYKIVHSHINQIDSVIFPIAKKYGVKHCISHSHNTKYSDYMLRAIRNWIMCLPLKKAADTWAACGVKAGEFLFGKNFMKSPKHLVINNAIDIDRFRYNAETRAWFYIRIRNRQCRKLKTAKKSEISVVSFCKTFRCC